MTFQAAKCLRIRGRPAAFYGTVRLPPSKSYLHRALFVSALARSQSQICNCGTELNEDIQATIRALSALGSTIERIKSNNGTIRVSPGVTGSQNVTLDAGGSGTTARFLIPFSSLSPAGAMVTLVGNASLLNRPMGAVFEPLVSLGVRARSQNADGRLPVVIEGGGIEGGDCIVDGSISSQFVSSLLITCLAGRKKSTIKIKDPKEQVSSPYLDATISVMKAFGFKIRSQKTLEGFYESFEIPGNQSVRGSKFEVPGDMSSGAVLVGTTVAAGGRIRLTNAGDKRFPQPDAMIIPFARLLGARIASKDRSISVMMNQNRIKQQSLKLDMKDSPDLVPVVAGLAAAMGVKILIENIGHLRFKESDRIKVLSRELSRIGIRISETDTSLEVDGSAPLAIKGTVAISPEGDHRMLMALTIAGISGRFVQLVIQDPDCVKKSYPSFISDVQKLCHEENTVKLVREK